MELDEWWSTVNEQVDLFFWGTVVLVLLDLLAAVWFVQGWLREPDLHAKFNLKPSDALVEQQRELENREPPEIELAKPSAPGPVPDTYAALRQDPEMYLPLNQRLNTQAGEIDFDPTPTQTAQADTETRKPPITGYQVTGRLFGSGGGLGATSGGEVVAVIQRPDGGLEPYSDASKDQSESAFQKATREGAVRKVIIEENASGKTFSLSEGEYIPTTDIRVRSVSDTAVWLGQPDHRNTMFQFRADRVQQQLQKSTQQ